MSPKYRFDGMPRVTLRNINRIEAQGCGWRVHFKRRRAEHVKYFPDGWDGPFASLRAAIEWRDAQWAVHGGATHVPVRATKRSSTGILGVTREVSQKDGAVYESYRASWTDERRTVRRRGFSIARFGEAEAKRRAIAARAAGEADAAKRRHELLLDVLHTHRALLPEPSPAADGKRPAGPMRKRRRST